MEKTYEEEMDKGLEKKKKEKKPKEKRPKEKKTKEKKTNFRSIKRALIMSYLIIIPMTLLILGYISIRYSREALLKETDQNLVSIAYESSKLIGNEVEAKKENIKAIAARENLKTMDWKLQKADLISIKGDVDFLELSVVDLDGLAYYLDGTNVQMGDRDYIKKSLNGEPASSDAIMDKKTMETSIMYSSPIENNGKVLGVLVGRRDGNCLSGISADTGFGDEGYGYLINSRGQVVGHPDNILVSRQFNPIRLSEKDDELKPLADFFQYVLEEKSGTSTYFHEGQQMLAGFMPIIWNGLDYDIHCKRRRCIGRPS